MAKNNNIPKEEEIVKDVVEITQEVDSTEQLVTMVLKKRKTTFTLNKSNDLIGTTPTCTIVSRLINPIHISYGSSSLLLAPRGKITDLNPEMLGVLPKGVDSIIKK